MSLRVSGLRPAPGRHADRDGQHQPNAGFGEARLHQPRWRGHRRPELLLLHLQRALHELHLGPGPRGPRRRPVFPVYTRLQVSVDGPCRRPWGTREDGKPRPEGCLNSLGSCRKRERECPRYVSDSGTHVGCHLDDLSGLTSYNYFLVNGTSQTTGIQFFDSVLRSKQIERYSPPANISVQCKPSSCLIRWERPSAHFRLDDRDFQYELVIQRQSRTQPPEYPMRIEVPGDSQNQYIFPSLEPRPKHTVKIRTGDARDAQDPRWGAWSRPVEFGSEDPDAGVVHVYVLIVLGTLGCALALGCLVKRFLRRHSLFQPVPRIKDKLNDNHPTDLQDVWEEFPAGAGKAEHEEVVTVQEVDRAPVSG
uniref:Fibronectin type-III domain-containing protein n=1 Tax=Equus caballus TaxID=9796 RepID=A0A3Q2HLC0_HORSE